MGEVILSGFGVIQLLWRAPDGLASLWGGERSTPHATLGPPCRLPRAADYLGDDFGYFAACCRAEDRRSTFAASRSASGAWSWSMTSPSRSDRR